MIRVAHTHEGVAPWAPFNDRSTKHASLHGLKERLAFFHDEWKSKSWSIRIEKVEQLFRDMLYGV
jgi:hypothetical protein